VFNGYNYFWEFMTMPNMFFSMMLLLSMMSVANQAMAQGVTFLIKGKVVDAQKRPLQGVQVIAKDGDELVGKSKSTVAGEFTLTLKPGRYYSMSFERNDLFMSKQDFRVPDGTKYQEINQEFQLRPLSKGDTIQQFPLFPTGQANAMPSPLFTMIPEMLKKMPHLKITVVVSEGKVTAKKTKAPKKKKGKKGSPAIVETASATLYDRRVEEIRSKLAIAGAPESRFTFVKSSLKAPIDVAVIVSTIASDF
jgi:hypothetical protein